jgi:hypothetical protein
MYNNIRNAPRFIQQQKRNSVAITEIPVDENQAE